MVQTNEEQIYRNLVLMLGFLCIATEPAASLERKVEILDRFNIPDKDKALICDASVGAIANARSRLKKARSGAK